MPRLKFLSIRAPEDLQICGPFKNMLKNTPNVTSFELKDITINLMTYSEIILNWPYLQHLKVELYEENLSIEDLAVTLFEKNYLNLKTVQFTDFPQNDTNLLGQFEKQFGVKVIHVETQTEE